MSIISLRLLFRVSFATIIDFYENRRGAYVHSTPFIQLFSAEHPLHQR